MKRIKLQEGRRRLQEGYLTDEGARAFRLDYPDGYTYKGVTIQYSRLGAYSVYDERPSKRVIGDPRVAMVYDGRNSLGFGVNWSGSGSWNASSKILNHSF